MARLAELSQGKTVQVLTKLANAGLTAEDAELLLRHPQLVAEVVAFIQQTPCWGEWRGFYVGTDWGHSLDTSALTVRWHRVGDCLFVEHDGQEKHVHVTSEPVEIAPGIEVHRSADTPPNLGWLGVRKDARLYR